MGDDSTAGSGPPEDPEQPAPPQRMPTRSNLEAVVRTVSAASAAGAVLGLLVGGVGGRLAMALLASQNPEDTGRLSDDGFRIGQFTLGGTIQLLAAATQIGLVAALIYLVLRPLTLGPRWLRIAELTAGGAITFAALLISPDGIDFTALDPDWLPVVLFLTIPAVYVVLLCLLAEHWSAPDSWFATAPIRHVGAVLLVWIIGGPVMLVMVAAIGIAVAWRHVAAGDPGRRRSGGAWAARGLLGLIGLWALVTLVGNVDAVT